MKVIYFISYVFKRVFQKVMEKVTDWSCKNLVISGKGTKFMISSNVLNSKGDKKWIRIGSNTVIRGELFTFRHGGEIIIGDYCYIGDMTKIWSAAKIVIGDRVLISHNVNIHDNIGHPIDAKLRHEHYKRIIESGHPEKDLFLNEKPVTIGNDVWIGFNATILKGVTVGEGAIIGACSLVTSDVPAFTVVAGNPAKFVRQVNNNN